MADTMQGAAWGGQQIKDIPLDSLVLWTENPRDPIRGRHSNDEVIRYALSKEHEKQWQLRKFAREMGDHFDMSELPTVSPLKGTSKYLVYDGNRRVILALLQRKGTLVDGDQFVLPLFPLDTIPCNVCDERTALEHVLRKHSKSGTWKPYERDLFMYRYMNGDETVLIRMERLTGAITKWPILNQRFVKDDVLNRKHLEEMGLLPDERDYGVDRNLLEELLQTIQEKMVLDELTTRNKRNDPVSVLPGDLISRIKENARHHTPSNPEDDEINMSKAQRRQSDCDQNDDSVDDSDAQDGFSLDGDYAPPQGDSSSHKARTRETHPIALPIFGASDSGRLALRPGDVNNLYRTLESLWQMYEQEKIKNSVAFPAVFRMGLRLLAEQAAEECDFEGNKLAAYVTKYAKEAKGKLRQLDRGKDITTFLATQSVKPENFIMLLQNGAHAYTSTNNGEQARAISILLGAMLTLSHGKE